MESRVTLARPRCENEPGIRSPRVRDTLSVSTLDHGARGSPPVDLKAVRFVQKRTNMLPLALLTEPKGFPGQTHANRRGVNNSLHPFGQSFPIARTNQDRVTAILVHGCNSSGVRGHDSQSCC